MEILFFLSLSIALFSKSLIVNLVFLLFSSVSMILFLEQEIVSTWGGVMFLIVFLTGLFVIFSYITSTSPKDIDMKKKMSFLKSFFIFFFFLSLFLSLKEESIVPTKFFFFFIDWSLGGFLFMIFLLVVIIILIRSTYSKGGAFRKKF